MREKNARLAKKNERLEKALTSANSPPNIEGEADGDEDDDDVLKRMKKMMWRMHSAVSAPIVLNR